LNQILKRQTSGFHDGSKVPAVTITVFPPSAIRLWNNLPTDLRNFPCQQMFKNEIRKVYDIPDKPPLYFSTGFRIANILHARLRQKCSRQNQSTTGKLKTVMTLTWYRHF
jgi:hypothetical protein